MNGGAYGAGKAASGQGFDAVGFLMRPHVMLRSLCWVSCKRIGNDTSLNAATLIYTIDRPLSY